MGGEREVNGRREWEEGMEAEKAGIVGFEASLGTGEHVSESGQERGTDREEDVT